MQSNDQLSLAVEALYTPQRIKRFNGNPLIEALPPSMDDESLVEALTEIPDFSPDERTWPTHERMQLVMGLSHFMVPLGRHIRLTRTLDTMMREGYIGRAPRTAEHIKVFQKLYENQQSGKSFASASAATPQLSTSLVGLSGVGKTTSVRRILAMTPQVIYHPELHIYQIPYLHVETPHDGASVKGLAHSILRKVDALIPDANYYDEFALRGKPSVETLMNHAARVLHKHCTGLLVVDEIQNLENAPKNKQSLMTLLVSASNELGVPILFIGTNKARRVLGLDFRQARRSVGQGLSYWDRLERGDNPQEPCEWNDFLETLWQFQWLQKPCDLTPQLSELVYFHTQGITDLAIKMFATAQWRAMLDGTEIITAKLLRDVANQELRLVRPMVEALRKEELEALESYDDIAPIDFETLLRSARIQYEGSRVKKASMRPGDKPFTSALTHTLTTLGMEEEHAAELAETVETVDQPTNLLGGVKAALVRLEPPKAKSGKKSSSSKPKPELPPHDLRNAVRRAETEGTTTFQQLQKMGAVCKLEQILQLG
jgi:hypothetical protein